MDEMDDRKVMKGKCSSEADRIIGKGRLKNRYDRIKMLLRKRVHLSFQEREKRTRSKEGIEYGGR